MYIERKTQAPKARIRHSVLARPATEVLLCADGSNKKVDIVNRETLEIVGFFGGHGATDSLIFITSTAPRPIPKATSTGRSQQRPPRAALELQRMTAQ